VAVSPLTHHEILTIVAPFTRRGRHVDLAASDRERRRLVFKPTSSAEDTDDRLRERLELECLEHGSFRLNRTVERRDGLKATLQALGSDPGVLLAEIESVPADRHFSAGPGYTIEHSYTVNDAGGGMAASLALAEGTVRVDGLALALRVPPVRGVAAEITLTRSAGSLDLPEDLLAVLGWNWTRLVRRGSEWTSRLRLAGGATERTHAAERALDRAAAHLARTLAEPPSAYHDRLRAARWGVFFRRGIPTWNALALVALALMTARFRHELPVAMWVALYHVPTLFVAASFLLQEMPRFEIPPWPRRLRAASWRDPAAEAPSGRGAKAGAPPRDRAPEGAGCASRIAHP